MVETKKINGQVFHNDALQLFNDKIYGNVLSMENLSSNKRAVKILDVKHYGYFFKRGKEMYFLDDFPEQDKSVIDVLPIKVIDKIEVDYSKDVFWYIKSYGSVKIPSSKVLSFRDMIDTLSCFKHTKPVHFTLSKILNVTALVSRINARIIAERGFGKDSVVNNLRDLGGSISNIYGATFAKLEYSLKHKYLVFNEMGNLKADDKQNMQQFLLATGAFFNKYVKKSRATDTTLEEYNISKTSLVIIYNPPQDYITKGQEYFDTMFTKAVANRFIPFYFEGTLSESFDAQFDVDKVVKENMDLYKNIISTILYYKNTNVTNKYAIPDDIKFDDTRKRFERSFFKIADYISEYSKDEKEYYELLYELFGAYEKYDDIVAEAMVNGNK